MCEFNAPQSDAMDTPVTSISQMSELKQEKCFIPSWSRSRPLSSVTAFGQPLRHTALVSGLNLVLASQASMHFSFTDLLQFAHSFLRPTLPQGWYPVLCFGADPGLSTMAGIAKYLINTVCQDTFSCFKNRYICPAFSPELLGQMRVPSCLSASGHCTGRCWTDYGVFCASLVKTEAPTASGH